MLAFCNLCFNFISFRFIGCGIMLLVHLCGENKIQTILMAYIGKKWFPGNRTSLTSLTSSMALWCRLLSKAIMSSTQWKHELESNGLIAFKAHNDLDTVKTTNCHWRTLSVCHNFDSCWWSIIPSIKSTINSQRNAGNIHHAHMHTCGLHSHYPTRLAAEI